MGAITGLLGTGGGASGTGFQGPSGANITNPTNAGQISGAYTGTQDALTSQQQLLAALQGQNGLGNQNQVYNQTQGIINGTGPNPALAQLNQTTQQNVAQTAAQQAGQRGAASNVGLIARQAGQQGAATQQQAAGQAATLAAQQQLNAIGQAGTIANTQAANQVGQTNANTSAQQAEQQQLLNAQQGVNQAQVGSQGSVNTGNAALANTTMQGQQSLIGGALNGLGAGLGALAKGGVVMPKMADGGDPGTAQSAFSNPQSEFGKFLTGVGSQQQDVQDQTSSSPTSAQTLQKGSSNATSGIVHAFGQMGGSSSPGTMATAGGAADAADLAPLAVMAAAKGGKVPAMVSPGEKYLSPRAVEMVKRGANPMQVGETIPGKPKVGGAKNSYANDTVKRNLDVGGVVVPRSETKKKDSGRASAEFVHKVLAKRRAG